MGRTEPMTPEAIRAFADQLERADSRDHYAADMLRVAADLLGGEAAPDETRSWMVLAWLGQWRDHLPVEAVSQLQDLLGVAPSAPGGIPTTKDRRFRGSFCPGECVGNYMDPVSGQRYPCDHQTAPPAARPED